jgi:hypothetical protein
MPAGHLYYAAAAFVSLKKYAVAFFQFHLR